ncbi:hypothetical protein V1460_28960 [Streptomyces sp. SCSIO 30461]|uniref:hypothetical protein n=1 Tax=Streptomyces sp. SCSIO 30461 TaxID=3118085 RepID=UPI0030CFF284
MISAAARNNAEWCDAMCRAHGITGVFGEWAWTSESRTPPLYPDAVTLSPRAVARDVLEGIDRAAPGCSVKDSFGRLDLAADGFEVIIDARWIHRPATLATPVAPADVVWRPVRTVGDLARWSAAWSGGDEAMAGIFRTELLADRATTVLAGTTDGGRRTVAGAVVSRSTSVIGVSNLFCSDDDPERAWAGCLAAVARLWPGMPVVGWETGDALDAAVAQGCVPGDALRVWLAV